MNLTARMAAVIESFSRSHSGLTARFNEMEHLLASAAREVVSNTWENEQLARELTNANSANAKLSQELALCKAQISQQDLGTYSRQILTGYQGHPSAKRHKGDNGDGDNYQ